MTLNEKLKIRYKKANKQERQRILSVTGFTENEIMGVSNLPTIKQFKLVQEYPGSATLGTMVEIENPDPNFFKAPFWEEVIDSDKFVHHIYLLDCSGSMSTGRRDQGINRNLGAEMKTVSEVEGVKSTFTIIKFNSNVSVTKQFADYGSISYFDRAVDPSGYTALNDAILKGFELMTRHEGSNKPNHKYLFKIFTDGENNRSTEKTFLVAQTIEYYKQNNNVVVTFVGTNDDVQKCIDLYNVDRTNTLVHDNTERGFGETVSAYAVNTTSYMADVTRGVDVNKGFFKKLV